MLVLVNCPDSALESDGASAPTPRLKSQQALEDTRQQHERKGSGCLGVMNLESARAVGCSSAGGGMGRKGCSADRKLACAKDVRRGQQRRAEDVFFLR